ncbi:MAG: hypothetical protein ACTHOA_07265 [Rhodanobacter sp.]|jgi:hypothetical protein
MLPILLSSALAATVGAHASPSSRQIVPTSYEAGHFYAVGTTTEGKTLQLLVDSGGAGGSGFYVIDPATVSRLELQTSRCVLGAETLEVITTIPFAPGKGWPKSADTPCDATALVVPGIGKVTGKDGIIGAGYMPRHIWTFDYPARQLWIESADWKPDAGMHRAALGYQRNSAGGWGTGFARLRVQVAGQPLDLLLDTGATGKPSEAGEAASQAPTVHGVGVTSYITTSVLERWHRQHPGWPVVEAGDDLFGEHHATRIIGVPTMQVAGWIIGPVWFTERADANFHGSISQLTDRQVEGAAGANIFSHFVMTIDYPHGAVWFACASGCRAAEPIRSASGFDAASGRSAP